MEFPPSLEVGRHAIFQTGMIPPRVGVGQDICYLGSEVLTEESFYDFQPPNVTVVLGAYNLGAKTENYQE